MKGKNLVTIKVASKTSARPLINKSVSIGISDFLSGGFTNKIPTDSNGEAHFAVAESFFGTLKKELVYRNSYKTRWEARQSIFKYIETFYNRTRKHSYLENKSPVQFMEMKNVA